MSFADMRKLKPGDKSRDTSRKVEMVFFFGMLILLLVVCIGFIGWLAVNSDRIDAVLKRDQEIRAFTSQNENNSPSGIPMAMHWWLFQARR